MVFHNNDNQKYMYHIFKLKLPENKFKVFIKKDFTAKAFYTVEDYIKDKTYWRCISCRI